MKVLVTGGAGFIGSAVARRLVEAGNEVTVLDNLLTGFEENVPDGAELIRGDIRSLTTVRQACRGVDVVFHQAALRSVPKSIDDPFLSQDCNIAGTLSVLAAAEQEGVSRVIYASSSSVYGDTDGAINREDSPTGPESPYAVSKLAGENYCRVWTRVKGVSTVSLRYFNVFGPGQRPESKYAAVFPAFVSALLENRPPEVHWDGGQSRDFTYIEDVVSANLLAAKAGPQADGAAINVGGGGARTVNEVLKAISEAVGVWIDPRYLPKRRGDIRTTRADLTLAKQLLGWEPESDWDAAVGATVDWFLGTRPPARVNDA